MVGLAIQFKIGTVFPDHLFKNIKEFLRIYNNKTEYYLPFDLENLLKSQNEKENNLHVLYFINTFIQKNIRIKKSFEIQKPIS